MKYLARKPYSDAVKYMAIPSLSIYLEVGKKPWREGYLESSAHGQLELY